MTYQVYEVKSYEIDGELYFSKKQIREMLGIRHFETLKKHLEVLGLTNCHRLGWAEVKEILALKLFLYAKNGDFSRRMYKCLKDKGYLPKIFKHLGIDIDSEFQKIQNNYYKPKQS
ncbi:MAG: hypothetical protein RM338_03850 [Nostoc sp. DedQUE12a]|nr:hypothetical protein [Nostoc sp. DedQUE12a]